MINKRGNNFKKICLPIIAFVFVLVFIGCANTACGYSGNLVNIPHGDQIDAVFKHWGIESYWDVTLTGIDTGYHVWDDTWVSWCVDEHNYITPGKHYTVTLHSTYDPSNPCPDDDWDLVNWIINHRDTYESQGATKQEVQDAIWRYVNGGNTPPTTMGQQIADDAALNGEGFIPNEGDLVAILCYAGPNVQKTFIEVPVPATPCDVYIDDDYDSSTYGWGYDHFDSIQTGVNAVCECGTIHVYSGVYTESVTVTKSLKLLAIDPDVTIQCPTPPENIYVQESSAQYEYCLGLFGGTYSSGNDTIWGTETITVELNGFTIDANDVLPSDRYCSILMRNVNTDYCDHIASISDNTLININTAGNKQTFGMLGYGAMDIIIQENTIDQFQRGGIGLYSGYAEIIGNIVIGPDIDTVWAPNGIQLGYGASGIIGNNEVSQCGWPGTDWAGTGLMVVDTSDVIVEENHVHTCEQAIGIVDFPECLYGTTWASVVSTIDVFGNLIENNEWGISIANNVTGVNVEENEILNTMYDAIDVYSYDACAPPPTNIIISCNTIEGSGADGLWVGPLVTDIVDATCNWWGDCSGPYNATWNPAGMGDSVMGNAEADPWVGQVMAIANGPYIDGDCTSDFTINFDGSGSTAVACCSDSVYYEWDFGDGTTSNQLSPAHTFTNPGEYTITLTIIIDALGQTCVDTASTTATVYYVSADAGGPYYIGEDIDDYTIEFDGSGSTGYQTPLAYEWDFGDGGTATDITPSHTYASPGAYHVTLTVMDASGQCVDTDTATVDITGDDPPIIQLITPEDGDNVNNMVTVKWFAIDDDYPGGNGIPIHLYYKPSTIGNNDWRQISGLLTNNLDEEHGDCDWDTNGLADGEYDLLAEASDLEGNTARHCITITIGNGNSGAIISEVIIEDTSIDSTHYVKNGDTVTITAWITGRVSEIEGDITADLTGFGLGDSVSADSFNGFSATWTLNDVTCDPHNGEISITVYVDESKGNGVIIADNTLPEISIEKPLGGIYVFNKRIMPFNRAIIIGSINVDVSIVDEGLIDHVDFYLDTVLIESIDSEPFTWTCNVKSWKGTYTMKALVYDSAGNSNKVSQEVTLINLNGIEW